MIICNPKQARSIYSQVADHAANKANDLNLPEDVSDYNSFRRAVMAKYELLDKGSFRVAYKVKNYVLKTPRSLAGAKQNIIEHYTAMACLPYTPRGTMLILHNWQGYQIPVLAVPYQDLSIRQEIYNHVDLGRSGEYNYTGDWAQYGADPDTGRIYLTDWALTRGDLDQAQDCQNSQGSPANEFTCGCVTDANGAICDRCDSRHCAQCQLNRCANNNCNQDLCSNCTCGHCSYEYCGDTRCDGCKPEEEEKE